jgi:hypothetical protein
MGRGKTTDQTHKDKLSTDYKTRTDDEHINEEDKQELHQERGKLAIPKREENPALKDLKLKRGKKG